MWTSLLAVLLLADTKTRAFAGGGGGGGVSSKASKKPATKSSDDLSKIQAVTGDVASRLIEENDSLLVLFYDANENNKLVVKILEKLDTDKDS